MHQQIRLESLKQKLLGLHHLETEMENQLKEAEWDFVTELAALARVPVTVKKQLFKRSKPAEEKTNSKRGALKSPKSEDKDDSCENIQESLELNSSSCRERLKRPHEGETEPRKNTKMLKKRGNR
ncbi:UNVERIFIED_CONTAM: hypothetical protein H355_005260 [Colinus virginianus]|nr:hypothetical protein H355_005260 [Colinus virginianus]